MGACRIAYYLLGHDYGSVKPEQIASINTSIAEWLAQGWSVLSVTPYGAGGTTAHLIITYTRRPAS
jgi:hypothetical protein